MASTSSPKYDTLSAESRSLFTSHYHLDQLRVALKSRASSHLHLDALGILHLQHGLHSRWSLGTSSLDAGFRLQDRKAVGPFNLQMDARFAYASPLISGSLASDLSGRWYHLEGKAHFEMGTTRSFTASGVVTAGRLSAGTQVEVDTRVRKVHQSWTLQARLRPDLNLMLQAEEHFNFTTDYLAAPNSDKLNYTIGLYQQRAKKGHSLSNWSKIPRFKALQRFKVPKIAKKSKNEEAQPPEGELNGLEVTFPAGHTYPRLTFGCTRLLDQWTLLKTKLNSEGEVGAVLLYNLVPGWITLSICGLFNGKCKATQFGASLEVIE